MPNPTQHRVARNTAPEVNARIRDFAIGKIERALQGDPIDVRLQELDEEWDTERTLQTNFAVVALLGVALSFKHRAWLVLTTVAAGFMVQHSLQGWCPPLPVLRRLGCRDAGEIERERTALRALKERKHRSPPTRSKGHARDVSGSTSHRDQEHG